MEIKHYSSQCFTLDPDIGPKIQWTWPKEDRRTFRLITYDWINSIRPFLLETFKNKEGSVIQAGGNCGVYPYLFTEFFNHVYTFEPDPLLFYCLVNNCQESNIIKYNSALSDKNEMVLIKKPVPLNMGMNQVEITEDKESLQAIPSVAIDNFEFNNVKLIQLDLEGFEVNALNGAKRTIEKYKPIMILECGDLNNPADEKHINQLNEKMESLNYKILTRISRLDVVYIHKDM